MSSKRKKLKELELERKINLGAAHVFAVFGGMDAALLVKDWNNNDTFDNVALAFGLLICAGAGSYYFKQAHNIKQIINKRQR